MPPEQTADNALAEDVSQIAEQAGKALADAAVPAFEAFAARGHSIIADGLARAKQLAAAYPQVGALMPLIEGTLHDLFAHMLAGPQPAKQAITAVIADLKTDEDRKAAAAAFYAGMGTDQSPASIDVEPAAPVQTDKVSHMAVDPTDLPPLPSSVPGAQ